MAKKDYTKTPGNGWSPKDSERDGVSAPSTPASGHLPTMPLVIKGIAETAGFPEGTMSGEALIESNMAGKYGLRDGPENDKAHGTLPDYPVDLMDKFGAGKDTRNRS